MAECQVSVWKDKTEYNSACLILKQSWKPRRNCSCWGVGLGKKKKFAEGSDGRNKSSSFLSNSSSSYSQIILHGRPLPIILIKVNLRKNLIYIKAVLLHLFLLHIHPYKMSRAHRYAAIHSQTGINFRTIVYPQNPSHWNHITKFLI